MPFCQNIMDNIQNISVPWKHEILKNTMCVCQPVATAQMSIEYSKMPCSEFLKYK